MTKLLMIKDNLKQIYSKYSFYVTAVIKLLAILISMIIINSNIGAMGLLKNPAVVAIISIVGALLPSKLIVLMLSLIMTAHLSAIAIEIAAMFLVILIVMYLLFFRFTPKDSAILIILPITFFIGIPYVVPLIVGMVNTPVSIISVLFGVVVYFILSYIGVNFDAVVEAAKNDGMGQMVDIAKEVFTSKGLYLTMIAFALVIVLVYFIKRLSIDYSWIIAIITGGIMCMVMMLIGAFVFDLSEVISVLSIILGGIISIAIAMLARVFIHTVDYQRTEYTQFEDDDYYYYVKAVPKIKVSAKNVKVKKINQRQIRRDYTE